MNDPRNWAIGCLGAIVLCCILVCGPLFIGTNLLTGGIGTGLGFLLDAEEPAEVRVVEPGSSEGNWSKGPDNQSDALGTSSQNDEPAPPATSSGIPVQFGSFPVGQGFGINAVIGADNNGQGFNFYANRSQIYPYETDCRPFNEAAPFYGKNTVTRCDYLFAEKHGTIEVTTPSSFSAQKHGISLIGTSTSDTSWILP